MEWTQFAILIITMGGMFFWNRSEASADRRESHTIMREMRTEIKEEISAILLEMKDFHNRLCKIEAERK